MKDSKPSSATRSERLAAIRADIERLLKNRKSIVGVVMPVHPTIDKIIALWLILQATGKKLKEIKVEFYSTSDPLSKRVAELVKAGFYPLDIGPNKYQNRGARSAAEVVCLDFGLKLETDRPEDFHPHLVAMANRNNSTGYLKGCHSKLGHGGEKWPVPFKSARPQELDLASLNWSIAYLLREAYKIDYKPYEVVGHVIRALDAWAMKLVTIDARVSRQYMPEKIRECWKIFGEPEVESLPIFSVPMLINDVGTWAQEIWLPENERGWKDWQVELISEVNWWIELQKKLIPVILEARAWARRIADSRLMERAKRDGYMFELQHLPGRYGLFIRDVSEIQVRELLRLQPEVPGGYDDPAVARLIAAIWGRDKSVTLDVALIAAKSKNTGRVAILPGRQHLDFGEVYARLRGFEQKSREELSDSQREHNYRGPVWHLEVKGNLQQLLNGSDNWPLPPTVLDDPTIIRCLRESTWALGERPERK